MQGSGIAQELDWAGGHAWVGWDWVIVDTAGVVGDGVACAAVILGLIVGAADGIVVDTGAGGWGCVGTTGAGMLVGSWWGGCCAIVDECALVLVVLWRFLWMVLQSLCCDCRWGLDALGLG